MRRAQSARSESPVPDGRLDRKGVGSPLPGACDDAQDDLQGVEGAWVRDDANVGCHQVGLQTTDRLMLGAI